MRPPHLLVFALTIVLAVGCGKSKKPVVEEEVPEPPPPAVDVTALLKRLRSPTAKFQMEAVDALVRAAPNEPTVVPGLIEALNEKGNRGLGSLRPSEPSSVREAAVIALLRITPSGEAALVEKGLPILIAGLGDPSPAVREHTAAAIARMGEKGRPATEKLWVLAADQDSFVRGAAYDALLEIGPDSSKPLASLLTHRDPRIRDHASEHLRDFPPLPPDAVPELVKALGDKTPQVRAAAASGLAQIGSASKPALDPLVKLLPAAELDDEGFLRPIYYPILRALAAIGEPAVAPLTPMVDDMETVVRWQAVHVLGLIGEKSKPALPKLEQHLNDQSGQVAGEAVWAFVRAGGDPAKATPLIESALKLDDEMQKIAVLQLVARMGPAGRKFSTQIFPLLSDPEPEIRHAALEFVGSIPPVDAKPAVPILAKKLADASEGVGMRRRIAELFEWMGPEASEAAESLGKAVSTDKDVTVRRGAAEALRNLGESGAAGLPGLTKVVTDSGADLEVRTRAIAALPVVGPSDASATEALLKASKDGKNAEVRSAAAAALVKQSKPSAAVVTRLTELASSDKDFGVRLVAFRSLGKLGPAGAAARPTIEPLASGPAPDVALWAKVVVARIDNKPDDLTAAIRAGLDSRSPAERLAAATAFSLLPAVEPADLQKLALLIHGSAHNVRRAAVESAGEVGPTAKPIVPELVKVTRDSDSDLALAAVVALGKIGETKQGVIPALRQLLSKNPTVAAAARATLHKLGYDFSASETDNRGRRRGNNN